MFEKTICKSVIVKLSRVPIPYWLMIVYPNVATFSFGKKDILRKIDQFEKRQGKNNMKAARTQTFWSELYLIIFMALQIWSCPQMTSMQQPTLATIR